MPIGPAACGYPPKRFIGEQIRKRASPVSPLAFLKHLESHFFKSVLSRDSRCDTTHQLAPPGAKL